MNFLQDRKNQIKKRNTLTLVVSIFFVFLVAHFGFPDFTRNIFSRIFSSFIKTESTIVDSLGESTKHLLSKRSILEENERLREEIDALNIKLVDYQITKDENNDLRAFVGGFDNLNSFKVARVISRPPVTFYDTLLLDTGEEGGVTIGSYVYVSGSIVIGEVSEVYKNTSLVSLYSFPEKETKGIMIPSDTEITLIGRGGGSFEANVPRGLEINEGMIVTFPNRENDILAIVLSNIADPRDSLNTVLFKSPVNYNNLKFVGIKIK